MKATFTYTQEEVCRIVLQYHENLFPSPKGMSWGSRGTGYGGAVTIEADEDPTTQPMEEAHDVTAAPLR